jgi:uncharacterized protein (TIGR00251 family)
MNWVKTHEIKGEIGTLLLLYVQPGASKSGVRGTYQDRLKLSVQSPPVDGAANEAVIEYLSKTLNVSKKNIHLLSGETSRQKNIWIKSKLEEIISVLGPVLEKVMSQK